MLVATDGSETAAKAVSEAADLAAGTGARVYVMTAYQPLRAKVSSGRTVSPEVGDWHLAQDSQADSILDAACATLRLRGVEAEPHARKGDPADAIIDLAEELGTDLSAVDGGAPQTIMILGSDKRNKEISGKYGLSDTTMLLRLDPDRDAIALQQLITVWTRPSGAFLEIDYARFRVVAKCPTSGAQVIPRHYESSRSKASIRTRWRPRSARPPQAPNTVAECDSKSRYRDPHRSLHPFG